MPEATAVAQPAVETPKSTAPVASQPAPEAAADDTTLLGAGEEGSDEGAEGGETETPKTKAPENYEFKVPEGMELNQEVLNEFLPLFKEADLSQELAQKLVEKHSAVMQKAVDSHRQSAIDDYNKMADDWKRATIKEVGADYKKQLAPVAKLIEKTGFGNEIRELLEETKLGNHPTMVKFLIWMSKSFAEDSFADANQSPVGGLTSLYDHPTSKATLK